MGDGSQPIPNAHWAPVQFVLTVPTIRDRVVQTAATLVLEPIFEADFDEAAHGYRPKRSALDAVNRTGFVGGPIPREDVAHGTTE
jgi:retron-type reverse transcriptase